LEPIAVRLERDQLEEVKSIGAAEGKTKSAIGKMLIEMGLEVYNQKGSLSRENAYLRRKLKTIKEVLEQNGI
jgi:membrane-bound lytic murein transglycosylase